MFFPKVRPRHSLSCHIILEGGLLFSSGSPNMPDAEVCGPHFDGTCTRALVVQLKRLRVEVERFSLLRVSSVAQHLGHGHAN